MLRYLRALMMVEQINSNTIMKLFPTTIAFLIMDNINWAILSSKVLDTKEYRQLMHINFNSRLKHGRQIQN